MPKSRTRKTKKRPRPSLRAVSHTPAPKVTTPSTWVGPTDHFDLPRSLRSYIETLFERMAETCIKQHPFDEPCDCIASAAVELGKCVTGYVLAKVCDKELEYVTLMNDGTWTADDAFQAALLV